MKIKMDDKGTIYLGKITTFSGPISDHKKKTKITHTPLLASVKEVSDIKDFLENKFKNLINKKIEDPTGREAMLKILYACLPQMARHQLFLKKKEEYHKKKEEEEWRRHEEQENDKEEECYRRFLKEFRLSEDVLKERLGKERFNTLKSYKATKFFTHLYYEPLSSGGKGTKEDPIILNILAGKELVSNIRPDLLYGLLSKFFQNMTERKIKSFIYKYNLNPNDWEDMRQEVLIRFEKAKKMFDPKKAEMWTYLSRVADNSIINFTKKNTRKDVELNEEIIKDKPDIEENLDKDIDNECLTSALENLNEEDKNVIKLMYFDGLSQADIAKKINKSQPTVSRVIERAIQQLRSDNSLNKRIVNKK
jgi:RNA polymerase sigma-70 factor (ECF subfamily)